MNPSGHQRSSGHVYTQHFFTPHHLPRLHRLDLNTHTAARRLTPTSPNLTLTSPRFTAPPWPPHHPVPPSPKSSSPSQSPCPPRPVPAQSHSTK
ncbi:hypothetical protein E2C01_019906 [Portunus trituberculatus]|uniref:Uncharacterized protein n=1 Tax=Portunus trituberculatus TaxID=210409 RepID=A0A5B7E041_PORTR|nr:hypothetical protein [Portunus trituberculatus]